jgi:hypothetical protein
MMTLELLQRKAIKIALRLPISTSTKEAYKLARIDNINDRFEALSKRYLQKATSNNQLIKDLVDNHDPSRKPRIRNSEKPILNHLQPQTTQSTTIRQPTRTNNCEDNWQRLIDFVDQLDL